MNKVWESTFTERTRNVIHKFYLRGDLIIQSLVLEIKS